MKRRYIIVKKVVATLAVVALGVVVVSCQKRKEDYSTISKSIPVDCVVLGEEQAMISHQYVGEVKASKMTEMSFIHGGRVTEVSAKIGQRVSIGDILAIVDTINAHSALLTAKASLSQAEDAWERVKQVYDGGGVSEAQWKEVQTKVQQARSLYLMAQTELDNCKLTSPQEGVIAAMDIRVGQTVLPSQKVATIIDENKMEVEFSVPEQEIAKIQIGQRVKVEIKSIDATLEATVTEKNMVADAMSHSYRCKAVLRLATEAERKGIVSGMICNIKVEEIQKGKEKEGQMLLLVPATCCHTRVEGTALWVVREGRARLQIVKVKGYDKKGIIIEEGIKANDTIVTAGMQKLYDGCPIEIRKISRSGDE